jgi:hypothetical protein
LTAAATWTPLGDLLGTRVKLPEASADPANGTDFGSLYTKDVSGATELFYRDAAGNVKQLTTGGKLNVSATEAVLLTGNQTVAGIKTFSSIPVLPNSTPTADNEAARKKYVDDTYLSGQAVQVVNTQLATYSAISGDPVIPDDDTIPQNTEGAEIMTLAITPKASANKLLIEVVIHWAASHDSVCSFALFQDSTANALFACQDWPHSPWSRSKPMHFRYFMAAGTTSETTFKVRGGFDVSGRTLYINGDDGGPGRKFGGVMACSITITEIKV